MSIKVQSLSKFYGDKEVLSDFSIEIKSGEIYGILGPNGSGKTTLLKIMAGISQFDSGSVTVEGIDARKDQIAIRKIVGYVPETPYLYESLTPYEYFSFVGSIREIPKDVAQRRADDLTKAFGMEEYNDQFIGSLSFGTRQKVSIIASLIHAPKILILDESINGLDPQSAKIFRDLLASLAQDGMTVVFSTHILEIAENVCEEITIMKSGKIVAEGRTSELLKERNLEDVFMDLTSTEDITSVVSALRGTLR
ncbi:MAG: ABC transporter ATP-binding protein [Candidatus Thermoplasmatota archaeon]|nr:ABC transporter ATP-binding protein [Candidatus Thermoplasmatota archaeon]MCL6002461.1 ABC transporter ATP-binding protein [Candidatus Thermoplasmatota archaeon]